MSDDLSGLGLTEAEQKTCESFCDYLYPAVENLIKEGLKNHGLESGIYGASVVQGVLLCELGRSVGSTFLRETGKPNRVLQEELERHFATRLIEEIREYINANARVLPPNP